MHNPNEVMAPNDVTGEVMKDLQGRRAIIMGMDSVGHYTRISAKVPQAALYKYSSTLRSITQGKASFSASFGEYAATPPAIQEEVIAEHKHLVAEEV
jgi:elongation factor G